MHKHYGEEDTTYSSLAANGQLQPVFERSGLRASRTAYQTTFLGQGTGRGPNIAGGANSQRYGDGGGSLGDTGAAYGGGASGSDGPANQAAADIAANDPFNVQTSPVLWACVFLIVGLLGLRYVHWRG
jgi:hypothetical protein